MSSKKHKWDPHSHCRVCGKAIPPDTLYCSTRCENLMTKRKKGMQTRTRIYYAGTIGLVILFVITWLLQTQ